MKHKISIPGFTTLVVSMVCALSGYSQSTFTANTLRLDSGGVSPVAHIEQMSWLAGTWKGEGFGGVLEESWLPPAGGSMVSIFRMMKDNKPVIFEINQIVEEKNSLVLKVKHFSRNLTAWEEKEKYVSFPLVKMGTKSAWFDGASFQLSEAGQLVIYLVVEQKGKQEEHTLILSRAH